MVSAIPGNRFPALALVAAAHALAIALLLELTRAHSFSGAAEESLTLVEVLPARPRASTLPLTAAPASAPSKRAAAPPGEAPIAPPRPPAADAGSAAIDWAAEGAEAAARVDHCAIALLWVVPFFGCQIGKIPARGDLFEHMRDAPGPDLH